MQNFEEKLNQMSKPEIGPLKHQDTLAEAISKAKDKSVLSGWWLSIPLYLLAAFCMKSLFMPNTSLLSNLHELSSRDKYTALFCFLVLPFAFAIINVFSIRNIYMLSGSALSIPFLQKTWFNLLMLLLALLIIIIFILSIIAL